MTLTVDLAAFEGPLDLLLHLIKELKIDIFDIPIVLVTQQYLHFLEQMEEMQLDIASDYLLMAATLIEIKTKMMLPKPPKIEEEEGDPRENLVQQLVVYKQYQEASHILENKQMQRQLAFAKEPSNLSQYQEKIPLKENELNTNDLFSALQKMMNRLQQERPVQATVSGDSYSVDEAMVAIKQKLKENPRKRVSFRDILEGHIPTRHRMVTLFLGLLELVKAGEIYLQQDHAFEDIVLIRNEEKDEFSREN